MPRIIFALYVFFSPAQPQQHQHQEFAHRTWASKVEEESQWKKGSSTLIGAARA
jgi:hypothetical protein